jgi:hypothetical protein
MENAEGLSLTQMEALLETSQDVQFAGKGRREIYAWVEHVLVRREYARQGKKAKGAVWAYLAKMTGKSMPRITRLVRQYRRCGRGITGGADLSGCTQRRTYGCWRNWIRRTKG